MMITKTIKKLKMLKKENAQTMVEFAIVFPIVLLITYGLIEFGRLIFIYAAVTGAAREGARYGAAAGDIGDGTPYYMDCSGIRTATQRGAILIPIANSDIKIWYDYGPNTDHIPNADTNTYICPPINSDGEDMIGLGDRIGVHVEVRYLPIIPLPGLDEAGFPIRSENARTILVNVDIPGTPPSPVPTNPPTATPTKTNTPTPTPTKTPKPHP